MNWTRAGWQTVYGSEHFQRRHLATQGERCLVTRLSIRIAIPTTFRSPRGDEFADPSDPRDGLLTPQRPAFSVALSNGHSQLSHNLQHEVDLVGHLSGSHYPNNFKLSCLEIFMYSNGN